MLYKIPQVNKTYLEVKMVKLPTFQVLLLSVLLSYKVVYIIWKKTGWFVGLFTACSHSYLHFC